MTRGWASVDYIARDIPEGPLLDWLHAALLCHVAIRLLVLLIIGLVRIVFEQHLTSLIAHTLVKGEGWCLQVGPMRHLASGSRPLYLAENRLRLGSLIMRTEATSLSFLRSLVLLGGGCLHRVAAAACEHLYEEGENCEYVQLATSLKSRKK